jgi:hypothetical protein
MTETPDPEIYEGNSVDDEDQPGAEAAMDDPAEDLEDPLDRGYSPPEKWSVAQGYGNTPREEALGESLDQRLEQEEPEPDPYAEPPDELDEADEDREVGDHRSGRLVAPDEGLTGDAEKDAVAQDVGIDGAAASAEEAAVHEIDPDESGQA